MATKRWGYKVGKVNFAYVMRLTFLNPRSFSFRRGPITEDSNIRPVGNFTDNSMKRLIELRRSPQGSPLLASLAK